MSLADATTMPLPELPASWVAALTAIGVILTAIATLVGILWKKQGTTTTNVQSLAAGVLANSKALNQSDATPNVPTQITESARAIRNDPTTPAPVPCGGTDPEP